jgi:hypothetical protein
MCKNPHGFILYILIASWPSELIQRTKYLEKLGTKKQQISLLRLAAMATKTGSSSKKEVFQPHLPVRLPCYDLAPVTSFTLGGSLRLPTLGTPSFHGLTGGVYKVRERIHRAIADARLLAIPASCSRVADYNLN